MKFHRTFSNAPWEKKIGYCRSVRVANQIFITGTAPIDEKRNTFGIGDPYLQAKRCIEIIEKTLKEQGSDLSKVVRTRMFVTDISLWKDFGKAHNEFFCDHPPATTMVEVKSLIDPNMLIEIEADAFARIKLESTTQFNPRSFTVVPATTIRR